MLNYRYKDVVISPHICITRHYNNPSLYGFVSVDDEHIGHFQYMKRTSRKCKNDHYTCVFEEEAIYCGYIFNAYGHFILESLSLYYFIKKLASLPTLVFSFMESECLLDYQKDILESLNIKNKIVILNETTLFRDIWIPPPGFALGSWFLDEQKDALEIFESNPIKDKKVYISRSKFSKKRGAVNEEKLEEELVIRNWKIIYPEKMKFSDVLYELGTAETIFCIAGSALHTIIFLKNIKSKLIVIPRTHTINYNIIAESKCTINNYFIFDAEIEDLTPEIMMKQDKSFLLNIDFIKKILIETDDFKNLKTKYFHKYEKPNFDYRDYNSVIKKISSVKDYNKVFEEDTFLYDFYNLNKSANNDSIVGKLYEVIAKRYFTEYSILYYCNICKKYDSELAINLLISGLNLFIKSFLSFANELIKYLVQLQKIKKNSNIGIVYRELAVYLLKRKEYILSLKFLNESLKNHGPLENHGTISEIYRTINLNDYAVCYCKKVIEELNIKTYWAYMHLSLSYMSVNNIIEAHNNVLIAQTLNPQSEWVLSLKNRIEKKIPSK